MAKTVTRTKADENTEAEEPEQEETESEGEGEVKVKKERKPRTPPDYRMEVVDDFPEEDIPESVGPGLKSVYLELLTDIAENNPGKVVRVAHFRTGGQAAVVVKEFEEGKRELPVGTLDNWLFRANRVANPETPSGRPLHSELFAKYTPSK